MNKLFKRLGSLMLALLMVLSIFQGVSITAQAEELETEASTVKVGSVELNQTAQGGDYVGVIDYKKSTVISPAQIESGAVSGATFYAIIGKKAYQITEGGISERVSGTAIEYKVTKELAEELFKKGIESEAISEDVIDFANPTQKLVIKAGYGKINGKSAYAELTLTNRYEVNYNLSFALKDAEKDSDGDYSLAKGLKYATEVKVVANGKKVSKPGDKLKITVADSAIAEVSGSAIVAKANGFTTATATYTYAEGKAVSQTLNVEVRNRKVDVTILNTETDEKVDVIAIYGQKRFDVFAGKDYTLDVKLENVGKYDTLDVDKYTIVNGTICTAAATKGVISISADAAEMETDSFTVKANGIEDCEDTVNVRAHTSAYAVAYLQGATFDGEYYRINKTTAKTQKAYTVQYKVVSPSGKQQYVENADVTLTADANQAVVDLKNSTPAQKKPKKAYKAATVAPKAAGKVAINVTVSTANVTASTVNPLMVRVFDASVVKSVEFGAVSDGAVTSLKGLPAATQKALKAKMTAWALGTERNAYSDIDEDLAVIVKDKDGNTISAEDAGLTLSYKISNKTLEKYWHDDVLVDVKDMEAPSGSAITLDRNSLPTYASFTVKITAKAQNGKKATYTVKVNNPFVSSMSANSYVCVGTSSTGTLNMGTGYTAAERAAAAKSVSGQAVGKALEDGLKVVDNVTAKKLTKAEKASAVVYTATKTGVKYTVGAKVATGSSFEFVYKYSDDKTPATKTLKTITVTEKTTADKLGVTGKIATELNDLSVPAYGEEVTLAAKGKVVSTGAINFKSYDAYARVKITNTTVGAENVQLAPTKWSVKNSYSISSYGGNEYQIRFFNKKANKVAITFQTTDGSKAKVTVNFKLDNTNTNTVVGDKYFDYSYVFIGDATEDTKVTEFSLAKGKSLKLATYVGANDMYGWGENVPDGHGYWTYKPYKVSVKGTKVVTTNVADTKVDGKAVSKTMTLKNNTVSTKNAKVGDVMLVKANTVKGTTKGADQYYLIRVTEPVKEIKTYALGASDHDRYIRLDKYTDAPTYRWVDPTDTTLKATGKATAKAETYTAQYVAGANNDFAIAYVVDGECDVKVTGAGSGYESGGVVYAWANKPGTIKITFTAKDKTNFKKTVTVKFTK